MSRRADYAIVGGGPAGLAVGILAALAGRRAIVIERRRGPVDKACGEGLMPPGVAWLGRMGVDIPPGHAWPLRGIQYVDGDAAAAAEFVEGPGLGIRRTVLSAALQRRAEALGVEIRHACEARAFAARPDHVTVTTSGGEVEARWLVGADGLHGSVRTACRFAVTTGARRRVGLRRHFRIAPWSEMVEVHWGDGAEAYVTPVGPDCVGIAFLWSAARTRASGYEALLAQFPELRARLGAGALPPVTAPRGAGPFDVRVRPVVRGRVVLVGDASGYVDALTGEGLSLAFASAAALIEATAGDDASAYARSWRRARRQHVAMTRLVLAMGERPRLRRRVVAALGAAPEAFRALLAVNTGARGFPDGAAALGRLGWSMLAAHAQPTRRAPPSAPVPAPASGPFPSDRRGPSTGAARPLVLLSNVSKWYDNGAHRTVVLAEASLVVEEGQFVVVLGPSGSGKSTLLNLIGAMDQPSRGTVTVAGVDVGNESSAARAALRRDKIGFVFQFYNLFPTLTAAENVEASLAVLGLPRGEIARRIRQYLAAVGLADRAGAFPSQLSGGQQQRVAIARALAKEPPLVLADEPTGNLDADTGDQVVRLMRMQSERAGTAFIVVTHNAEIARLADRVIRIVAGSIVEK